MKRIVAALFALVLTIGSIFTTPLALAAEVSSIEQKPFPGVVDQTVVDPTTGEGSTYIATIVMVDDLGQLYIVGVKEDGTPSDDTAGLMILLSLSDAQKIVAGNQQASELENAIAGNLVVAYQEVKQEWEDEKDVQNVLNDKADGLDERLDSSIFVVSDLFDITLTGSLEDKLFANGNYLKVTLRLTGLDADDLFIVMHKKEATQKWTVVPDEQIENNGDGTITVLFDSLCPIAILRVDQQKVDDILNNNPVQLNLVWLWILIAIVIIVIIVIIFFLIKNKKDKKETEEQQS